MKTEVDAKDLARVRAVLCLRVEMPVVVGDVHIMRWLGEQEHVGCPTPSVSPRGATRGALTPSVTGNARSPVVTCAKYQGQEGQN